MRQSETYASERLSGDDATVKRESFTTQNGKTTLAVEYHASTKWQDAPRFQNGPRVRYVRGQWQMIGKYSARLNPHQTGWALLVSGNGGGAISSESKGLKILAGIGGQNAAGIANMDNDGFAYVQGYAGRTARWYISIGDTLEMKGRSEMELDGLLTV